MQSAPLFMLCRVDTFSLPHHLHCALSNHTGVVEDIRKLPLYNQPLVENYQMPSLISHPHRRLNTVFYFHAVYKYERSLQRHILAHQEFQISFTLEWNGSTVLKWLHSHR